MKFQRDIESPQSNGRPSWGWTRTIEHRINGQAPYYWAILVVGFKIRLWICIEHADLHRKVVKLMIRTKVDFDKHFSLRNILDSKLDRNKRPGTQSFPLEAFQFFIYFFRCLPHRFFFIVNQACFKTPNISLWGRCNHYPFFVMLIHLDSWICSLTVLILRRVRLPLLVQFVTINLLNCNTSLLNPQIYQTQVSCCLFSCRLTELDWSKWRERLIRSRPHWLSTARRSLEIHSFSWADWKRIEWIRHSPWPCKSKEW